MFYENWIIIPLIVGGLWGLGDLEGVSGGGGENEIGNIVVFSSKRAPSTEETEVYIQKTKNRHTYSDFGI